MLMNSKIFYGIVNIIRTVEPRRPIKLFVVDSQANLFAAVSSWQGEKVAAIGKR